MEKVYQVMAWALAVTFAIVVLLSSYDANALTLKSGEVLTKSGVVSADKTESAKRNLANQGYHIGGGNVYLDVNGETITVSLQDIRGKSKAEVREVIGAAATEQLEDLNTAVEATVAEFQAENMEAINAVAMSAEEIADHIMNSDAVEGAIVGATEEVMDAVNDILANEVVTDAAGIEYNPNNGPCSGAGC